MASPSDITVHALVRSPLVLAGLLLLSVGIGNSITGHSKIVQYEEVLRTTPSAPPPDPAVLFPKPSEASETRALAQTKLVFYQRLLSIGQLLSALGFALLAAGVLRLLRPAVRLAN